MRIGDVNNIFPIMQNLLFSTIDINMKTCYDFIFAKFAVLASLSIIVK